jgi:hypothetical protein
MLQTTPRTKSFAGFAALRRDEVATNRYNTKAQLVKAAASTWSQAL